MLSRDVPVMFQEYAVYPDVTGITWIRTRMHVKAKPNSTQNSMTAKITLVIQIIWQVSTFFQRVEQEHEDRNLNLSELWVYAHTVKQNPIAVCVHQRFFFATVCLLVCVRAIWTTNEVCFRFLCNPIYQFSTTFRPVSRKDPKFAFLFFTTEADFARVWAIEFPKSFEIQTFVQKGNGNNGVHPNCNPWDTPGLSIPQKGIFSRTMLCVPGLGQPVPAVWQLWASWWCLLQPLAGLTFPSTSVHGPQLTWQLRILCRGRQAPHQGLQQQQQ